MVDDYRLQCRPVRDRPVRYLDERRPVDGLLTGGLVVLCAAILVVRAEQRSKPEFPTPNPNRTTTLWKPVNWCCHTTVSGAPNG